MSKLSMVLLIIMIILLIITTGCGFAIHYGKDAFKDAVTGHMVLGVLCLIFAVFLLGSILIKK
ncbi:hypothetical protein KHQ81_14030 [Mycoplasmatota bacterium]|nr:hypothetical protein KHQ81_14030 [Mycoplasmatota bacterium]